MKLWIRNQGQKRSLGDGRALAVCGALLGRLLGVRRLSLRMAARGAAPRAELIIERGDRVSAYRLGGRLLRWTQAASPWVARRLLATPRATPADG